MDRKRILLVDDSDTVIALERMILSKGPYELRVARDGQEAVEQALLDPPDLILMDVVMPRLTGFQAAQELRRHEATRDIPIIIVTTRGQEKSVEMGFKSGCRDYVTKPIDGLELVAKVTMHLGS